MTYRVFTPGLALILLAGVTVLGAGPPAYASNAAMTTCSQAWDAAKKAGTVPQGQSWSQFYSQCAAKLKKGTAATNTDAAKKTKKEKAAAKAPPAEDTASYVPDEPGANDQPIPTKDASGKPLTAGEIAFRKRIKECGAEWRQDKAKGKLPATAKWPQFWSACDTRLKKQG